MVEAGDPLTITVRITGRGDFDRVTVPQISDPSGWKTYPPSAKFQADDDIGISGAKSFEMAVIPQDSKSMSPTLEWSYFDPIKEQYVTLTGQGTPIKVEGEPQAAAAPVAALQRGAQPSSHSGSAGYYVYPRGIDGLGKDFRTALREPALLGSAGGAFAGASRLRRNASRPQTCRRPGGPPARPMAEGERGGNLNDPATGLPEAELYQAAARALRLEAAIQLGRDPRHARRPGGGQCARTGRILGEKVRRYSTAMRKCCTPALPAGQDAASSAQSRVDLLETVKGYENAKRA